MSYLDEQRTTVTLYEIKVVEQTDGALLIDYDGDELWVPESQIMAQGPDWLRIPIWLAKKKGLC